jgi:hypothetical protein
MNLFNILKSATRTRSAGLKKNGAKFKLTGMSITGTVCLVTAISDKSRLIDIPKVYGHGCQRGHGPLVKEISGSTDPVAGILCGRIPAKQREPDIDSAKRISSGLPKKGGNAALLERK